MSKTTSEEECMTPDTPSGASASSPASLNNDDTAKDYESKSHLQVHASSPPALLHAARNGSAMVYAIFGGQGVLSPLRELQDLYTQSPTIVAGLLERASAHLQRLLDDNPSFSVHYPAGLDIMSWILDPGQQPLPHTLSRAPISLLLIGLLQLANYYVLAHSLDLCPGDMGTFFCGIGGHSQGVVPAVMASAARDWESLDELSLTALTILFYIGCRAQSLFDPAPVDGDVLQDRETHGEGVPSCMLRVHGLSLDVLTEVVDKVNHHLPQCKQAELALINGPRNFVLGGPPTTLSAVSRCLRRITASPGVSQARVPYSQRKPEVTISFLPISVPFHTSHLSTACTLVLHDLRDMYLARADLRIPVYDSSDGSDLKDGTGRDVIPDLVRMIMTGRLDWPATARFAGATHMVDLGPGIREDGIGALTDRLKQGTGVRTIIFGLRNASSSSSPSPPELGDREELLHGSTAIPGRDWRREYGPHLVLSAAAPAIETKMTTLLGLPPLMVAGMTPTTSSWEFVAATMNAGYHIELAAGGFPDAASFEAAIRAVVAHAPAGRGVSCNVIYANPRALSWQLATIQKLQAEHLPIDGLTIGAGIPSPDTVDGYLRDMPLLRHISFKPGSLQAIREVIAIAKMHPHFPIILQWTGGRAGGHHSFEDFHEPILQSYHRIRACANIVLVAGSGFGDAADSYPYLTGECRVMVARETRTSDAAKELIVATPGVADDKWEGTYSRPTGGVLTVISEMGEPIHMLATRAVQLWSELDRRFFSVQDKAVRLQMLLKEEPQIIARLNRDFAKVWFGRTESGTVVHPAEMTYAELAARLIDLTYLRPRTRWIHSSYCELAYEFLAHVESRFAPRTEGVRVIASIQKIREDPYEALERLKLQYPGLQGQLLSHQDEAIFTAMCRRRGRKPVPFITALDDEFEYYFKKDSLWQSEDLDAVQGEDIQRTCVLHGPVAARYTQRSDQTIKEILDEVYHGYIGFLEQSGPVCLRNSGKGKPEHERFEVDDDCLAEEQVWYQRLAAGRSSYFQAAVLSQTVMRDRQVLTNPVRAVLKPRADTWVVIDGLPDQSEVLSLWERHDTEGERKVAKIRVGSAGLIDLELINYVTGTGEPAVLALQFGPGSTQHPLRDLTANLNGRVQTLYHRIWFGDEPLPSPSVSIFSEFDGGEFTVRPASLRLFSTSIGSRKHSQRHHDPRIAPLDYAVVVAWKALIKPLFVLDVNLLRLVHLQNSFEWIDPIRDNDILATKSRVSSLVVQESGTVVEVKATISRSGRPIVTITSQFMLRGAKSLPPGIIPFRTVDDQPYRVTLGSASAVAVLESKPWFQRHDRSTKLLGATLLFRPQSRYLYDVKGKVTQVEVTGAVQLESDVRGGLVQIGAIHWHSRTPTNIVTGYLTRHGRQSTSRVLFDSPLELALTPDTFSAPTDNLMYAYASKDLNPIHLSKPMAAYAELPGTITHGMNISARVRALLCLHLCGGDESLFHRFTVSFTDMVLPDEQLQLSAQHIGMVDGTRVIEFTARDQAGRTVVAKGEAEIRNAPTAMLFTGQGSQRKGMGMELRQSSAVARQLWDRADAYFVNTYGFRISDIVINNPKKLTVRFGGPLGRKIRDNYRALRYLVPDGDAFKPTQIFPELDDNTASYTFSHDTGLLFATQFAQPALTLTEVAIYEDLKSRGLVSPTTTFAGHSLGEYAAIAAFGGVVPLETLMAIAFYRGNAMQLAVQRDSAGRSAFAMCALNPSRLSPALNADQVDRIVKTVSEMTGLLIEIVNYNIHGQQYVCAGDVRALLCLTRLLDSQHEFHLDNSSSVGEALAQILPSIPQTPLSAEDLPRGSATTPLAGIDVPFHSSFMKDGIPAFRQFLYAYIQCQHVDPQRLIKRYVPNLTARRFDIDRAYFEVTESLTGSPVLRRVLDQWDEIHTETNDAARIVQMLKTFQEKIALLLYYCGLCLYRIYFHPLAKYPGPLLARISDWYIAFHSWKGDLPKDIFECHGKYGDVVRYGPNRIIFNTAQAHTDIHGFQSKVLKVPGYAALAQSAPSILTLRDAQEHARRRRVISSSLSDDCVRSYEPAIISMIKKFCDKLVEKTDVQDVTEWCNFLLFDITMKTVFGAESDLLGRSQFRHIPEMIHASSVRLCVFFYDRTLQTFGLDRWIFWKSILGRNEFVRFLQRIVKSRLAASTPSEAAVDQPRDIFSHLLPSKGKGNHTGADDPLSLAVLRAECATLVIAGSDTSSAALAGVLFYLGRYRDAYQRAAAEVRSRFERAEDIRIGGVLSSCKYLNACITESMRLSPPVGAALLREAPPGGCTIGGEFVPGGTHVGVGLYSMHHNANHFTDPFTFRPERWLGEIDETDFRHVPSAYAPFSIGPRSCIGKGIAKHELMLELAYILRTLDFEAVTPDGQPAVVSGPVEKPIRGVNELPLDECISGVADKVYLKVRQLEPVN
ncbi:hypothetical protein CFD26_107307 [Aspergillus turcosus]|uniref:fatty-acyl-CoA synthase system n=1 Tax=Aspergillus turcosus TaxID=1245748 RepID=A0A421DBP9_9EURO|nr:hypothetical protein CFD26_107307 [Aspergillus turcosus]